MDYSGEATDFYLAFSPDGQMLTANDNAIGFRYWRVPTLAEIDAEEAKQTAASRGQ
jgi:hypothetical protein